MSDDKPASRRGPAPPQAKYQRKVKPVDDEYSSKSTLVDYEWNPSAAPKGDAAVAVLEEGVVVEAVDEDLPEIDVEMEPLD